MTVAPSAPKLPDAAPLPVWSQRIRWTIWIGWSLLVINRLLLRDRWQPFAAVCYGTPWLVLAVIGLIAAWWTARAWRTAGRLLGIGCGLLLMVAIAADYQFSAPRPYPTPVDTDQRPLRFAVWNVAHGKLADWSQLAAAIRDWEADVVLLVEGKGSEPGRAEFWQKAFPGYAVWGGTGDFICLCRGNILSAETFLVDNSGHSFVGRFNLQTSAIDRPFTLFAVDIVSNPLVDRRDALREILRMTNGESDQPCLIAGDFNTPDDSLGFDAFRAAGLRHAFREAGTGWTPTWPVPCPVLTLDQVWINQHWELHTCEQGWSRYSDHRPVMCRLSLKKHSTPDHRKP